MFSLSVEGLSFQVYYLFPPCDLHSRPLFYIVKSNHDLALDRYLNETRFIKEPQNALIGAKLLTASLENYDPLEFAMGLYGGVNANVKFLQEDDDLVLEVDVPINLPHRQLATEGLPRSMGHWGQAQVAVRFHRFIWIEEVISLVEKSIQDSTGTPESVESVCRQIGTILAEHSAISWFKVVVENLAHGYSTFASMAEDRRGL